MFWAPRLYQCFLMSFVIKNWILYSLQFSPSRLCATALTNKVFLSQTHSFSLRFCHLIYACLCGSIALILQYKDKITQRDGMKRLFEVISKSQVNSTARHERWTQMFSTLLNSSSVSRCCRKWRRGDGKSEPRYGTVSYKLRLQHGQGRDYMLFSACRKERTLIWLLSLEMGIVRADWSATHCSGFHFSWVWLKIHRDQSC